MLCYDLTSISFMGNCFFIFIWTRPENEIFFREEERKEF